VVKSSLMQPINAVLMSLFLIGSFLHLQQGLQVIIEDYFYKWYWITLNNVLCSILCFIGLLSVGKIVIFG
jgi:succinate dehydrogenase hydrophobic anchor subunit